jgi:hypothetical protein
MWMINNQFNFNLNAWFQICEQGKFDDIENDIYSEKLYQAKALVHKHYINNKRPIGAASKLVSILYYELKKYKGEELRREVEQAINYIVKVATIIFPDDRFRILKKAIRVFRKTKIGQEGPKNRAQKWEKLVEGIVNSFEGNELISIAVERVGLVYISTYARGGENKNALGEYGRKALEEKLMVERLLKINEPNDQEEVCGEKPKWPILEGEDDQWLEKF